MPKDKSGKQITWKEFMQRWKQGIEQISVEDQLKHQIRSNRIILVGILGGLVIAIMNLKNLWWLGLIMLGALFNTYLQHLAVKQKFKNIKNFERRSVKNDTVKK